MISPKIPRDLDAFYDLTKMIANLAEIGFVAKAAFRSMHAFGSQVATK